MTDYQPLFEFLGKIVVVSPLFLTLLLGISSLLDRKLSEQASARAVYLSIVSGLLAAIAIMVLMVLLGNHHITVALGNWVVIPHQYHFSVKLIFDRLSVPFAILSFVLSGTIGAFATKYMHRERGYNRFFVLYAIFVLGMVITSLAGTIEMLFAGWELVGLSSALLVAFFQERSAPSRNGLWVWVIYRVSDAALLLAAVVMHHLRGEGDFDTLLGAGPWPDGVSLVARDQALVVGLLLVVAAAGKSALIPFSGWLPRAMEGADLSRTAVVSGALLWSISAALHAAAGQPAPGSVAATLRAHRGSGFDDGDFCVFDVQRANGHQIGALVRVVISGRVDCCRDRAGVSLRRPDSSPGSRLPENAPVRACSDALARLRCARKRDRRPAAANGYAAGTDGHEPAPDPALPPGTRARASGLASGGVCGASVRPDVPVVRCRGAALDRFPFRPCLTGIRPG